MGITKPFIILAMPRSMTAWTSCFLTCGNTFCQHEVFTQNETAHLQIANSVMRSPFKYSGIACPGSVMIWHRLFDLLPNANYIYIRRPVNESKRALASVAGVDQATIGEGYEVLQSLAETFIQVAEPRVIDYSELKTIEGMRKLWQWVCPDEYLPPEHLNKMHSLHIEQRKELIHAQVLG
jgi:hypothetical protein